MNRESRIENREEIPNSQFPIPNLGGPLRVILTALGIFLLSQFLAGLLVMVGQAVIAPRTSLLDSLTQSAPLQFFYVLIAEVLAIALTIFVVREVRGVSLAAIGLGRLPALRDVSRAIGGALAFYGLIIIASVIINLFFPDINTRESQDVGFDALNSSLDWGLAIVALVILPPLGEETLMRGYLYSGLRARWRFIPAMLVTSLLFGLAHLGSGGNSPLWLAVVHTFLLSIVLVYLRERSGALYAGMLVHAANNAIAFTVAF